MDRKIIIIPVVIFSLLTDNLVSGMDTLEFSSYIENENSVIETVLSFKLYSLYLSNSISTLDFADSSCFSFASSNLKGGKMKRGGLWRELFDPFGFSASSEVYSESEILKNDFSPDSKGEYGISFYLPGGSRFSSVFYPYFFGGIDKKIRINDGFAITGFFSGTGNVLSVEQEWIEDYTELYLSESAYTGIRAQVYHRNSAADILFSVSGNRYFRSDVLLRALLRLKKENLAADLLYVFAGRDYILPVGNPVDDRIKLAADWLYTPLKWIGFNAEAEYLAGQNTSYPSVCIGQQAGISAGAKVERGIVKAGIGAGYGDEGESNGDYKIYYSIKGFLMIGTSSLFLKISAEERGLGGDPEKRVIKGEAGATEGVVAVKASMSVAADNCSRGFHEAEGSGKAQLDFPWGKIYLSLSSSFNLLSGRLHPSITGFKIGCKTETGF